MNTEQVVELLDQIIKDVAKIVARDRDMWAVAMITTALIAQGRGTSEATEVARIVKRIRDELK